MRGALLFIIFVLLHFITVESKICPKCEVPPFLKTEHPLNVTPSQPLEIKTCLYPSDIKLHPKLIEISKIATPVCLYIIPLRDDFLQFYFPSSNDTYFDTFWEENGDRCLKYFNNEVYGFYNFEKYGNLPTDIIYSCSRPFNDSIEYSDDEREDQLDIYLSKLVLQYVQEMEGKPSHRVMRCYDRDTDLSNSHWTLYTCMFAVMNRTFNIGPLSFNSFFVDHSNSSDFSLLKNTFLSAQSRQEGCAIADLNKEINDVEIIKTKKSYNYLNDGECTGTLNLFGFDLLCCCYLNVHNCLYTAPTDFVSNHSDIRSIESYQLKDNQFLCIKGFLNSTSPELKFRGKRDDILTKLSQQCYTMFTVTYDKDLVFNVSITFGSADDNETSINCNENYDGSNSKAYLKSPAGFQANYNVQKEPIEIVRCCRGNFCNHYGMFDYENAYAWPKKFQFKMNRDWKMRCGYLPLDIYWNFFRKANDSHECTRVISEEKTQEILPVIGGMDLINLPLYNIKQRDDANFTGILPANAMPITCFYAPVPKSASLNKSGIPYVPRMVFGCSINQTFTLPFSDSPDFNSQINLYQQNILRKLKNQYVPFPNCLTTNGASLELLSFLRVDKMEKLLWYPLCFAMIYRDFHGTYYRSGACNSNETCCEPQYWADGLFDVSKYTRNSTTNRLIGELYGNYSQPLYRCTSLSCKASQMESRCFYYAVAQFTPADIVSKLHDQGFKDNLYSVSPPVSLTVDTLTGYDPLTFNEKNGKREVTAFDISCTSSDQCFEEGSTFRKFDVSSAFPFCIWNLQRQYGSDFSREVLVADATNLPDRARFQMDCEFDFGKANAASIDTTEDSSSLQTESPPLDENEKIVKADL